MRLPRLLGVALATTSLALTAAACGGGADSSSSDAASFGSCPLTGKAGQYHLTTVKSGVLTIKADLPSAGWWDGDTVDKIHSGYEYCLAAEIAHEAGLKKISLQNVSFDKLVSGTLTGYDLSLDEISITPERQKVVDFSDPYYNSAIGVLAKPGTNISGSSIRSMRLGVKEGTAAQQWVSDVLKPASSPRVYPGDAEALAAVASGQVDAYLQDVAIELGQAKQSNGTVKVVGQFPTDQSYGIMLPKGSSNTTVVNKIIADAKQSGLLTKLTKTYLGPAFGGDPSTVPVWSAS